MRKPKSKPTRSHAGKKQSPRPAEPEKIPFSAHLRELRRRFFVIALLAIVFGGVAYTLQKPLTALLLKPAGDQQFIYTTPGGGFDFLFKLCLYTGIAASIPIIVYQLLRYLQPLAKRQTMRFIVWCTLISSCLALTGIVFGYIFGLPAAMHFLLQGFSSEQIKALISIQSYMSFVMLYLLGSALLFQLPLILITLNRITPLRPKTLMKHQRWVIVGAFVAGAIISPSPDIRNQLMLSGPIILMYQISILLIWAINRKGRRSKKVIALLQKDAETQATRLANFVKAQEAWRAAVEAAAFDPTAPADLDNNKAKNRQPIRAE